jgi:hypothetical protein
MRLKVEKLHSRLVNRRKCEAEMRSIIVALLDWSRAETASDDPTKRLAGESGLREFGDLQAEAEQVSPSSERH